MSLHTFGQERKNGTNEEQSIRIATFNTSLFRSSKNQLIKDLKSGSLKAKKVAAIIQNVRPDIILLNEFDFDSKHEAIRVFQTEYLQKPQFDQQPIQFEYSFLKSVNTGVSTPFDLNKDGKRNGPGDSFGFGKFPGQYGMVVLSRFPIDQKSSRTFQNFLWQDMPDALLPRNEDKSHYYSEAERKRFRLSSKSHWDVAIKLPNSTVLHFLVSHPTPPVFDGKEDRNGRRNHDEIRFWNDYIQPQKSRYIYDDNNRKGGLAKDARFVIAGDLNADPQDGDSTDHPIQLLLNNPLVNAKETPSSEGAVESSLKGKANLNHKNRPEFDTAQFNPNSTGNLRIDYVLPSSNLRIKDAKVFWPKKDASLRNLLTASDHRMVYVDIGARNE